MKSPHDSPKPKVSGNLVYKKKHDESNNSVEDRRPYNSSPYYKGLLCHDKVSSITTKPESTTPIVHDVQNLLSPSPYYKGLLYTERVDHGTSTGIGIGTGTTLEVETNAAISHEYLVSPYYKGLLYTERVDHGMSTGTGTGTTLEVETTAATPHEFLVSPDYKGLLNPATSPDRAASSSSRMSLSSAKKPKFGFSKFKPKDERPPTLVKVYSTGNSNDQKSLRERGSEPTSPQFSPPLPLPEPPSEPPLPPPLVLEFDAYGALCTLRY